MKRIKRTLTMVLVIIMIVGVVPATSFNKGKGVYAASGSDLINDALSFAVFGDYLNPRTPKVQYVWGGLDLTVGVDCSGFVCAMYKRHGLDLVSMNIRSSYDMMQNPTKFGTVVNGTDPSLIQNGDILVTNSGGHVALGFVYNGIPYMVHAANHNMGVIYHPISDYNSAIVMIIRPKVITSPGTVTALPKDDGSGSGSGSGSGAKNNDPNNPGAPYAIPTLVTTGDSVKWIQTALNKVEGAGLTVDGSFGQLTKAAISAFQTKYGLTVNGTGDTPTINKLVEIYTATNNITSISIIGYNDNTLEEDDSLDLDVSIKPDTAKNAPVTWSSSNNNVAMVSGTGVVTGTGTGEVVITAKTSNGKSASITISVKGKKRANEWYGGRWYSADGTVSYEPTGSWKGGSGGWWFEDTSGWYPKNEWVRIDRRWYYFNSKGYIYANGWYQIDGVYYYFYPSGEIAQNEWVGGYWLSGDGGWYYYAIGKWKQDANGWWFEDTAGWYPKNEIIEIENVKYSFDSSGYWLSR